MPYFQREAGILRRCLASIFAQKINPIIVMHVIVIDDASPWSAEEELRDMTIPGYTTIDVIKRNNGGPAAARNSGLDHVSLGTDFAAFIDSDDTWRDDHIQRAVDALGNSNDLYFSDHLQWDGLSSFDKGEFGTFVKIRQPSSLRPLATVKAVWICSNTDIIPYAVKDLVAHMSTIVYRRSTLSAYRFDEELWYGEDDLFLLDLLFTSIHTCVSTETEVSLGLGINLFYGSWSWDSDNNLKRCCHQLIFYKKLRRRRQTELTKTVTQIILSCRLALIFFIVRHIWKGRRVSLSLFTSLLRHDPQFFATLPVNIPRVVAKWVSGKLRGDTAFR